MPTLSAVVDFATFLQGGDEASALALLESDRIPLHSTWPTLGAFDLPVFFLAISNNCMAVVRELSRRGESLGKHYSYGDGESLLPIWSGSSVGFAIRQGKPEDAAVLHRLGAGILNIYSCQKNPPSWRDEFALECAIGSGEAACLARF